MSPLQTATPFSPTLRQSVTAQTAQTAPSVPYSPDPLLPPQPLAPGAWVRLHRLPSAYAYDRALLLCALRDDRWITWIPDHGEAELTLADFYAEI